MQNRNTEEARQKLVVKLKAMLDGKVPFLECAGSVHNLRYHIVNITPDDSDFNVLGEVEEKIKHLPLTHQRHLWSEDSLIRVEPGIKRLEEWAGSYAKQACENLIERFDVKK